jgi:hypothetical protein
MTTATQVQFRRGSASQVAVFTGAQGETVVDTTNNRLVVQDGATAGGFVAGKLADLIQQRAIRSSADLPVQATDVKLNCIVSTALAITVPAASTRAVNTSTIAGGGLALRLTIKNLPSSTANVTLNRTGSDTFDGETSWVLAPGQGVTLDPYNDGVNNSLGYGVI